MTDHLKRLRRGLSELTATALAVVTAFVMLSGAAAAAPYAAFAMDGRTGKEIYSRNADTRLHPASLTKMMTLYMAFSAVEQGKVRLDSRFTVSSHAASQPPSRLGLRPGQKIELRYLIRAAAVKSANDAATVIGEGLAGSEAKFAAQMTAMARALGMRNSNFRNANGLTVDGHYSSARDMTLLGRRLFYDFPQYYNIFSRRSADAGVAKVTSTNSRFLDSYQGADGIKTGYTRAAGFNLTASAQRGSKRIIATVMGGSSTAHRNQQMAELLDAGFGRVPVRVAEIKPKPVAPQPERVRRAEPAIIARSTPAPVAVPAPSARPASLALAPSAAADGQALSLALAAAMASQPAAQASTAVVIAAAPASSSAARDAAVRLALAASMRPQSRPEGSAPDSATETRAEAAAAPSAATLGSSPRPPRARRDAAAAQPAEKKPAREAAAIAAPTRGPERVILASVSGPETRPADRETISRSTTTGAKMWGVNLGRYRSQQEAEQLLLKTALQEATSLDGALRKVAKTKRGFEANFVGLTKGEAALACEKLAARSQNCTILGP